MAAVVRLVEFDRPLDYQAEIKARADRIRLLMIPERRYLMIDGRGAPGGDDFAQAIASLYPVAYTLHFVLKKRGVSEPVGALEGLFEERSRVAAAWHWRLMLPVPDSASDEDVDAAIEQVRAKAGAPRLEDVRCERWQEGSAAQIMHIGPYDDEDDSVARLDAAIAERGLKAHGLHHEIYISDPGRTAPERLKTIIRRAVGEA